LLGREMYYMRRITDKGDESANSKVIAGAAVAGGVAGLVLLGPLTAVVAAGGAAYAATRKDDVGAAAQATGKATVAVGDKAVEFDKQHDISGKAKKAAADAARAASEFNEKHDVGGKVAHAWTSSMNWITEKAGKK